MKGIQIRERPRLKQFMRKNRDSNSRDILLYEYESFVLLIVDVGHTSEKLISNEPDIKTCLSRSQDVLVRRSFNTSSSTLWEPSMNNPVQIVTNTSDCTRTIWWMALGVSLQNKNESIHWVSLMMRKVSCIMESKLSCF